MSMNDRIFKSYADIMPKMEGAILLTDEADIYYTTGFHTTARRPKQIGANAVVLLPDAVYFLIPSKWEHQVAEQVSIQCHIVVYDGAQADYFEKAAGLVGTAFSVIWTEFDTMPLALWNFFHEKFPKVVWMDITRKMEQARMVKSGCEIVRLKKSAAVAVAAMEYAQHSIREGMSEWDLAAEVEYQMRKRGSEGVPFTMKALSGQKSAVVTEVPGLRKIQRGDLVLLDFGAVCEGYASDWTRTFCVGEADKKQTDIYENVFRIKEACESLLKPGTSIEELVRTGKDMAEEAGYAEYYPAHLGHSVGIRSHERPVLDEGTEGILKEHMVITIEPGIYVPGIGGVRLEDEYLITKEGAEKLTGLHSEHWILAI